ncbi:MAG TPA: outer membrane protein assembly factor BamC [Gammaproteobacteria bacterium]|nr:outer membrane protein assembly factor BamC [Gammaproteobacteria bacterium]
MTILSGKKYLVLFTLALILGSCGWILEDHRYDYLEEKQSEPIEISSEQSTRPIIDFYPIPRTEEDLVGDSYEIPLPAQVFSSGSTNEIRMHKLGEIRWLYVETLPSSVWPLMKDFWASSNFGLSYEDPNSGIFESQELQVNSKQTKFQMKIEHGIRQASSEIFLSHLIKNTDNNWIRVPVEDNLEDDVLRDALDFLSDAPSTGGTSLVALNLNLGQKAVLKQSEDGSNFIEMNLEFPRAWAAVDRALKEALITVNDLDRTNGVFFVSFTQEEEEGFVRRLFKRNKNSKNPDFKIYVKKIGQNKCTITVDSASEAGKNFERDLLSEINQSLS